MQSSAQPRFFHESPCSTDTPGLQNPISAAGWQPRGVQNTAPGRDRGAATSGGLPNGCSANRPDTECYALPRSRTRTTKPSLGRTVWLGDTGTVRILPLPPPSFSALRPSRRESAGRGHVKQLTRLRWSRHRSTKTAGYIRDEVDKFGVRFGEHARGPVGTVFLASAYTAAAQDRMCE